MTLGDRVRRIRKEVCHGINQTEFAERLGVTRDEIGNIEGNRLKKPEGKMPLLLLICSEFGIRKEWLLEGEGEMQLPHDELDSYIDELVNESDNPFSALIRKALTAYLDADPEDRPALERFARSILDQK